MSLLTGCVTPGPVSDSLCLTVEPIYLSAGAIAALMPFVEDMRKIARHNATMERVCKTS